MMFDELYDNSSEDVIRKNKLELCVEIGELANETKCFKYWSNKTGKREDILEEYADCLIVLLFFFNIFQIELDENYDKVLEEDVILEFNELFYLSSLLMKNCSKNILKQILSHLINLGHILGFSDDEIVEGAIKKINKNKKRFEEGF